MPIPLRIVTFKRNITDENVTPVYAALLSWMGRSTPQEASWAARVQPSATWRPSTLAPTRGLSCSHCPARSSDTAVLSSKSTFRAAEGGPITTGRRQLRAGPVGQRPLDLTPASIHPITCPTHSSSSKKKKKPCAECTHVQLLGHVSWWCLTSSTGCVMVVVHHPTGTGTLLVKLLGYSMTLSIFSVLSFPDLCKLTTSPFL